MNACSLIQATKRVDHFHTVVFLAVGQILAVKRSGAQLPRGGDNRRIVVPDAVTLRQGHGPIDPPPTLPSTSGRAFNRRSTSRIRSGPIASFAFRRALS